MNTDPITAAIQAAVQEAFAAVIGGLIPPGARPALLNKEELARELRVCTKTIDRLRKEGLPHVMIGDNCPRFDLKRVLAWLDARPSDSTSDA